MVGLKHCVAQLTSPHALCISLCKMTIFIYGKEIFCLSLWDSPKWINELSAAFTSLKRCQVRFPGPLTTLWHDQSVFLCTDRGHRAELYLPCYRFTLQKGLLKINSRACSLGAHFWSLECIQLISRIHDCEVHPARFPSPTDKPGWKTALLPKAPSSPTEALSKDRSTRTLALLKEVRHL